MIDAGTDATGQLLDIQPLRPTDVSRLRLGWWSPVSPEELTRLLERRDGASVWMPATHEFAIVAPWRRREDVAHLIDLVAVRHPVELTQAAIDRARAAGTRLFLVVEISERRKDSFHERVGLQLLETVLSYELVVSGHSAREVDSNRFERVAELSNPRLDELMTVDSDAFPWIWQNSEAEFREYFRQPGVELFLLRDGALPIGYLGITVFPGWGHIDRVAVRQQWQGRGFGRLLTEFAIQRLASLGATRVGLTTQLRNVRSQNLYTALGFRRQAASDYRMYGAPLWQNETIDDLVTGK